MNKEWKVLPTTMFYFITLLFQHFSVLTAKTKKIYVTVPVAQTYSLHCRTVYIKHEEKMKTKTLWLELNKLGFLIQSKANRIV